MLNRQTTIAIVLSAVLSACGGGTSSDLASSLGGTVSAVDGKSYDEILASNVDGEAIAITIHEPDVLPTGEKFPLILHSHGYGGARQASRPNSGLMAQLLANGYGLVSLDERGHNQSGGAIRILDPDKEGQDWLQVLDWAEQNLEWLAYDASGLPDTGLGKGNPIIGAIGGSYGGGYQHLIHAIDNKRRLDALAPQITWHDLRYSLFSGNVFKSTWANLLSGVGNRPPNRQDQEVNDGLQQGLTTNQLDADKLALLYRNSLRSHCDDGNDTTTNGGLKPADVLYMQSHLDTLFNFNDAYHNYECMKGLGGDVRLMTKATGHGLQNGDGGDQCGGNDTAEVTYAWFQEKLQGIAGAADWIPAICFNLGSAGEDAVVVSDITRGGTAFVVPTKQLVVQEGSAVRITHELYTAPTSGDVLAGIPTIDLTITDPTGVNAGDPILFVGLGIKPAGSSVEPNEPVNFQIKPVRGWGQHPIGQGIGEGEMVGVFERLAAGDRVIAIYFSAHPDQYPGSGSIAATAIEVDATINLPLIGVGHGAPNPAP